MVERSYVAADSPEVLETRRLLALEVMEDPGTHAALERCGIGPGWHCLELGAGHGSIAQWMADRVGDSGRVVAVDQDPRFLHEIERPNLSIRALDVATDEIERDSFDLVHCRALLMHLPSPEAVLEKMLAATRPGGWLVVEEGDFSTFSAVDPLYPGAAEFDRTTRACWDFMHKVGRMDSYFGRRLPELMAPLQLRGAACRGLVRIARGGDSLAEFWSLTFQLPAVDAMIGASVVSRQQIDGVRALFADPSFTFVVAAVYTAWGRRAAE